MREIRPQIGPEIRNWPRPETKEGRKEPVRGISHTCVGVKSIQSAPSLVPAPPFTATGTPVPYPRRSPQQLVPHYFYLENVIDLGDISLSLSVNEEKEKEREGPWPCTHCTTVPLEVVRNPGLYSKNLIPMEIGILSSLAAQVSSRKRQFVR